MMALETLEGTTIMLIKYWNSNHVSWPKNMLNKIKINTELRPIYFDMLTPQSEIFSYLIPHLYFPYFIRVK
jgi:hypothetical protein